MAWHHTCTKPLTEPVMTQFFMHMSVAGPQRVKKHMYVKEITYRKTSNIRCTLVGNKIVDHSDVVGAPPVSAAPTISSFST